MTNVDTPYLGKPGAMLQLPAPRTLSAPPARGETVHTLLSGGTAVTKRLHAKKTFALDYSISTSTVADLLAGFYLGLYGNGPYVFVDLTVRNVLGLDVSTVGVRTQAALDWIQSTGTLARATGAPVGGSGVLTWTSLAASATLQPGLVANTANIAKAPAYLPGEPVTVSLYAKASSSVTASLQLTGYDTAGAVLVTSAATSMSLTTSYQRFTVTIAAGAGAFASAFYVLPRIVLGASVPTSVSIAAAQLEYGDVVSAWQPGNGAPRVVIQGGPGRDVNLFGYSDHTLSLAEI